MIRADNWILWAIVGCVILVLFIAIGILTNQPVSSLHKARQNAEDNSAFETDRIEEHEVKRACRSLVDVGLDYWLLDDTLPTRELEVAAALDLLYNHDDAWVQLDYLCDNYASSDPVRQKFARSSASHHEAIRAMCSEWWESEFVSWQEYRDSLSYGQGVTLATDIYVRNSSSEHQVEEFCWQAIGR